MRVAIVGTELSDIAPGAGGLEHLILGWATGLSRRYDVVVISVGHQSNLDLDQFQSISIGDLSQLAPLLNELDVDVAQLNNRPQWGASLPCPSLFTAHNDWDAWSTSVDWTLDDASEALSGATGCSAVSAFLAGTIESIFSTECKLLSPFVDQVFVETGDQSLAKERKVLFSGRLLQKKGVEFLVELSTHPLLACEDFFFTDFTRPWREPTSEHLALREMIESRPNCSLILPPNDRAQLAQLVATSSVCVVPSVWDEPFGLAAIEAIAAGTKVVASKVGGLPEAVGASGSVVDLSDRDGFAAAIRECLDDPVVDDGMRRDLCLRYSIDVSVERMSQLLEGVSQ